ncbi:MAG: hypothetical protein LBC04_00970 [Holosporaceae bacterium]|jgi:hypothetical protein|nr:hypothetical protein [Holosporaceae bacterium]
MKKTIIGSLLVSVIFLSAEGMAVLDHRSAQELVNSLASDPRVLDGMERVREAMDEDLLSYSEDKVAWNWFSEKQRMDIVKARTRVPECVFRYLIGSGGGGLRPF